MSTKVASAWYSLRWVCAPSSDGRITATGLPMNGRTPNTSTCLNRRFKALSDCHESPVPQTRARAP